MPQRAVGIGPMEVIIVLDAQLPIGIGKCGMGKVKTAVKHSSCHATALESLWQILPHIDGCGVDDARRSVHGRARHALGLDALDARVLRQFGHTVDGNVDNVYAPHLVNNTASVGRQDVGRLIAVGKGEQGKEVATGRCLGTQTTVAQAVTNVHHAARHLACDNSLLGLHRQCSQHDDEGYAFFMIAVF